MSILVQIEKVAQHRSNKFLASQDVPVSWNDSFHIPYVENVFANIPVFGLVGHHKAVKEWCIHLVHTHLPGTRPKWNLIHNL